MSVSPKKGAMDLAVELRLSLPKEMAEKLEPKTIDKLLASPIQRIQMQEAQGAKETPDSSPTNDQAQS